MRNYSFTRLMFGAQRHRLWSTGALPLLTVTLMSCGGRYGEPNSELESPTPSTATSWDECRRHRHPRGDTGGNGRQLLGIGVAFNMPQPIGSTLFEIESIDATTIRDDSGNPVTSVKVDDQELTGEVLGGTAPRHLEKTAWKGATLRGNLLCGDTTYLPVDLRIADTSPSSVTLGGQASPTQFALELKRPQDDKWVNACEWPADELPSDNIAFPVLGYWNTRGQHVLDGQKFSFACTDNAVIKCLEYGYLAPKTDTRPSDKESLFQACTRMMRADYCGTGLSYTKDGNPIDLEDTAGVVQHPHKPPLTFEGAWSADKMVCYHHERRPAVGQPTCLDPSKLPRCSSMKEAEKQFPLRPLLFNWSCASRTCANQVLSAQPSSSSPSSSSSSSAR